MLQRLRALEARRVWDALLILAFAMVIRWGMKVSTRARTRFAQLTAAGLSATIFFYVSINLMMVMGLAPVVGVPMPMLSYGGTVMLTVMIGFGLVQSVRVHRYSEVTSGKGALM